ncbi:MAG: methyltransferase domain-containing protein [Oleiphilaceae bacterium]|nr:methyltransferase domain-containing protein [Oleiphilaceae bacterium]
MKISDRFNLWSRVFGRGVYPHEMAWILDLPGRGAIMPARTVADRLPVKPDAHVLEIGPGSGYYSVEVARRIPEGTLTLLDIQQGMLEKSARKLKAAGMTHFSTCQSDGQSLPFESESFDALFMVTVFGEIEARDSFLREAARVLKANGVLSITEHHPDPDFESAREVAECLRQHGFVPLQKLGWRWAYTLNASKVIAGKSRQTGKPHSRERRPFVAVGSAAWN